MIIHIILGKKDLKIVLHMFLAKIWIPNCFCSNDPSNILLFSVYYQEENNKYSVESSGTSKWAPEQRGIASRSFGERSETAEWCCSYAQRWAVHVDFTQHSPSKSLVKFWRSCHHQNWNWSYKKRKRRMLWKKPSWGRTWSVSPKRTTDCRGCRWKECKQCRWREDTSSTPHNDRWTKSEARTKCSGTKCSGLWQFNNHLKSQENDKEIQKLEKKWKQEREARIKAEQRWSKH